MVLDNAAINSRLLIILVIIVGLISAVGVIISAVALGRPTAPDITISTSNRPISLDWAAAGGVVNGNGGSRSVTKRDVGGIRNNDVGPDQSVWTLALGYDNGGHDYRAEDGTIQGFGVDLIRAVCQSVGIQCRIVYDRYENCWTSIPGQYASGGQGLLGRWYDACVGWSPTPDRRNVFEFSPSYLEPDVSRLFIKKGNDPGLDDLSGKSIGFVRGSVSDERCLTSRHRHLATDQVVYADTPRQLVQLLRDDKVAAVFSSENLLASYLAEDDLQALEGKYQCTEEGYAAMTRKDSTFLSLWNKGFEKVKRDGSFEKLCQEAEPRHGKRGTVKCNAD